MKRSPLKLLYAYAHEDEALRDKLDEHLELLARPPLLAAFGSRSYEFQVCSAHIPWGRSDSQGRAERLRKVHELGSYLQQRARHEETDLLLIGEFQMGDLVSPILATLADSGVELPEELLCPTSCDRRKYWELIGFALRNQPMPLGESRPRSGTFELDQHVFRDSDLDDSTDTAAFRAMIQRSDSRATNRSDADIPPLETPVDVGPPTAVVRAALRPARRCVKANLCRPLFDGPAALREAVRYPKGRTLSERPDAP